MDSSGFLTVPTDYNVLTTKTRMRVLNAIHSRSPKISADDAKDEKRERLLANAVSELVATERSYINHLNIVVEYFMKPLREKNLVSARAFNVIFGQIETILSVNRELLRQLEAESKTIGECFLELAPYLKIYSTYVKSYDGALALIESIASENKEFAAFKARQESRPEVSLKLSALLITPVQRIPRFKLLLEEIIQYTPSHIEDYKLLQDALHEVASIANQINEFMHEHDNMQKMLQIQCSLTDSQPRILVPGRRFIKDGLLMKVSSNGNRSHKRAFFLFSDMLMYCKPLADDYTAANTLLCCCVVPLKHCKIDPLFNVGLQTGTLMKITCKDEELMLYTDNAEYGNSWIDALRSTIRRYSEFRQTLRKESTAKRPLRRAAILKQQEESLSKLARKRKSEAEEDIAINDDHCKQLVNDALYPLRQMHKVHDCLTNTPRKRQKLTLSQDAIDTIEPEQREERRALAEVDINELGSSQGQMRIQKQECIWKSDFDNVDNESDALNVSLAERLASNSENSFSSSAQGSRQDFASASNKENLHKRCTIL